MQVSQRVAFGSSRLKAFIARALPLAVVSLLFSSSAAGQEAAAFFRQNCVSCHTIGGGRLTGPDLQNVSERKERDWLVNFMLNPRGMIDSGDAYARQMLQESRGVIMPNVVGMTKDRAAALLDLIAEESALEESQFKGLQISDRPFTAVDIELGKQLFRGTRRLANGGAACISCHTMVGLGALSGGRLGPDLTRVYERLGGRRNLGAWLYAPATTTMQPLFTGHPLEAEEILPLLAYFEDSAKRGGEDQSAALLNFFFLALGGTVFALVLFDALWKGRFRAVRAPLVRAARWVR